MGGDDFESSVSHVVPMRITVIRRVFDQRSDWCDFEFRRDGIDSWCNQVDLGDVCGVCRYADRNARTVDHDFQFHTFAAFRRPDRRPPFCASTKVASAYTSDKLLTAEEK